MRFSEFIARLGCNLVGWLIIYSHLIWLAVVPRLGCGSESDELFRLTLASALLAIMGALMLGLARPLHGIVKYLKWLAYPGALMIPLAASAVYASIETYNTAGGTICQTSITGDWLAYWAALEILSLIIILFAGIGFIAISDQDE